MNNSHPVADLDTVDQMQTIIREDAQAQRGQAAALQRRAEDLKAQAAELLEQAANLERSAAMREQCLRDHQEQSTHGANPRPVPAR